MRYRPEWGEAGEFCINAACGAKDPERVSRDDCQNAVCGIKDIQTHFFCRVCGQCRERRVVLDPGSTWWVGAGGDLWHESAGVFVRNPDGRFLFFRRTIYPAGTLTVPSGHVDKGETPRQAAVRELEEEVTGLPDIAPDMVMRISTDDIVGDSCRRGSDEHRWHAYLLVLNSPITMRNVRVREEGEQPELLTLAHARTRDLTWPVRFVIERHAALLNAGQATGPR